MIRRPFGIGVIGAGHICKSHATAYLSMPELVRLVGIADIDLNRARAARSQYGFQEAFDDYKTLLARDDVQVVSVCTPAGLHAPIVIEAIKAGKHVLCEKPMATNLADADTIIRAADGGKSTVSFVFQLRSEAGHARTRWMAQHANIGPVLAARVCVQMNKKPAHYRSAPGRGSWSSDGGGVLINQAIHQVDALITFLGEPVSACGVMDTFVQPIEAEDTISGWVRFKSGAIATLFATVGAQRRECSIEITGEHASMRLSGDPDTGKFDWRLDARGSAVRRELTAAAMRACPGPPPDPPKWVMGLSKLIKKSRRKPWIPPHHWGHTAHIREFIQAAIGGAPAPVPPREARRSLELAVALYESALVGEVVTLPLSRDDRFYKGVDATAEVDAGKTRMPAMDRFTEATA